MNQNAPIHGSPFTCQVYDAAKVKIEELKHSGAFSVNDRVAFKIDRRRAGIAELNVTVSSPVGKNLPIEVKPLPDGRGEMIEFSPPAAGKYKIAVTYGDDEVPGSPVMFSVEEEGWARAYGDGLMRGRVSHPAAFKIDAQGLIGEPHVIVDGPDSVAKSTIELDTTMASRLSVICKINRLITSTSLIRSNPVKARSRLES
jgi:filamin